jgi:RNA polymerase sigma factor (sigma-70 family)
MGRPKEPEYLIELEALYEARFTAFLRAARAITRDTEAARDVVQEAFAAAVRSGASFRRDGRLETWLWRIVVRKAVDVERRRPHLEALQYDVARPAAEEDRPELVAAIRRLPERQRLILFLRYYADLDYAAIAEVLDVSPGTVGASLHAAHSALKVRLASA